MKQFGKISLALTLALMAGVAVSMPLAAVAKKATQPTERSQKVDSTYEYVYRVFDKLQTHWEPPAYDQTLDNALLSFTLNPDGKLASSQFKALTEGNGSAERALEFIKKNAPYGPFPATLQANQLEFKFKITPTSLQMISYEIVNPQQKQVVSANNLPIDGQQKGASLFYMVAQPTLSGKVTTWKDPAAQTSMEQSMTTYVNEVQDQIQQKWQLPEGVVSSERAVALLMIDRDGSLLSTTLKQSSGNPVIDKAALNAIMQSAPFTRVPAVAPSLPVEIEYVFERVAPEPSDIDAE